MRVASIDSPITIQKPFGLVENVTGTFIPQKLANIVGIDKMIVMAAKNFITKFRLLLIMLAKPSIIPSKIERCISTISIACLFSIITSSSKSSSSVLNLVSLAEAGFFKMRNSFKRAS